MRDIVITSKRIKKEAYILLACFIVAFVANIMAIAIYKTAWVEVVTQIGYVVVLTIILYILIAFFRGVLWLISRLFKR